MSQIFSILQLLADGHFHSGEELGRLLGVTRSAVWQTLRRLLDPSLELQAVRGRGYRILGGIDLLDEKKIQAEILAENCPYLSSIEILPIIDSTNNYLLKKNAAPSGYICFAEQQSAGRGRRGRDWISPFGKNLYFSLCWQFSGGLTALAGLSLAVGIAIARGLQKYGIQKAGLKWPNDLVHGQQKFGGILIEVTGDASGPCRTVIGVGLNLEMPHSSGRQITQQWTDIYSILGRRPERNRIAGLMLNELLAMLPDFENSGFSTVHTEWPKFDSLYGHAISILTNNGEVTGNAAGVDNSGNLLLKTDEAIRTFHSGEVSVRLIKNI